MINQKKINMTIIYVFLILSNIFVFIYNFLWGFSFYFLIGLIIYLGIILEDKKEKWELEKEEKGNIIFLWIYIIFKKIIK